MGWLLLSTNDTMASRSLVVIQPFEAAAHGWTRHAAKRLKETQVYVSHAEIIAKPRGEIDNMLSLMFCDSISDVWWSPEGGRKSLSS